jgi:O-antigen ligase
VLVTLASASRVRKLAAYITIFGTVYSFFSILQFLLSPTKIYGILESSVPFGTFVNRNNFAGFMELSIAVPLGMLFSGAVAKDKRLIYITASVLMGISIVASGSRGGVISLVLLVAFLAMMSYRNRRSSRKPIELLMGAAILAAIIAGTAFVGGENALTRISDDESVADGVVTRPQIWSTTFRMIAGSMPFGVGLGAYPVAYARYDQASGFERVEQAHSDYLQVLSDGGVVGGIIGLGFLFLVSRSGFAANKVGNIERRGIAVGAFGGVFGVLVHSLFDFNLHTTAVALLFLATLALLTACRSDYEDDSAEEKPRRHRTSRA